VNSDVHRFRRCYQALRTIHSHVLLYTCSYFEDESSIHIKTIRDNQTVKKGSDPGQDNRKIRYIGKVNLFLMSRENTMMELGDVCCTRNHVGELIYKTMLRSLDVL